MQKRSKKLSFSIAQKRRSSITKPEWEINPSNPTVILIFIKVCISFISHSQVFQLLFIHFEHDFFASYYKRSWKNEREKYKNDQRAKWFIQLFVCITEKLFMYRGKVIFFWCNLGWKIHLKLCSLAESLSYSEKTARSANFVHLVSLAKAETNTFNSRDSHFDFFYFYLKEYYIVMKMENFWKVKIIVIRCAQPGKSNLNSLRSS